jgi:hypothetical protein
MEGGVARFVDEMVGNYGGTTFGQKAVNFLEDKFDEFFSCLIDKFTDRTDDGSVKVAFGARGKSGGTIKNPVKRRIKKTGNEISGEGSIRPKMNAEDGSWQKRAGQSAGMIGSGKKFCGCGPRHG